MRKSWLTFVAPGMLAVGLTVFVLALLLVKVLWAWTIPDLFPGAVEQGLVSGSITWFASLKLAVFIAVLSAVTRISRRRKRSS